MTVNRPESPSSRAEELALAEARDLPPRAVDQRDAVAALTPCGPDCDRGHGPHESHNRRAR